MKQVVITILAGVAAAFVVYSIFGMPGLKSPETGTGQTGKPKINRIKEFRKILAKKQTGLRTVRVIDPNSSCSTYRIDESTLDNITEITHATYTVLGRWKQEAKDKFPEPPKEIKDLDGRDVYIVGFMYPLERPDVYGKLRKFNLMESTQTCCYGPRPDYNKYILTIMPDKVKFHRLAPVAVLGRFHVENRPKDGYIYRIEGYETIPAVSEEKVHSVDKADLAAKGIDYFDYTVIEVLEDQMGQQMKSENLHKKIIKIPKKLADWKGKYVCAEGYIAGRMPAPYGSNNEKIIVSKYPNANDAAVWNSVVIRLREDQTAPEIWTTRSVFTGKLKIQRDPRFWRWNGFIMLDQAYVGVPEKTE